jgi:sigma-B regulation protein RsbU (phosphoserine phosphatase)
LEQDLLVKKLSLQAESFQEGFETLIRCNNTNEMMKNFWHLLRGNFLVTNIYLLHKSSINAEWKIVGSEAKIENIDISLLNHKEQLTIRYFTNEKYNAGVVVPLSDSSYFGILIGHKLDGSGLTEFDKITLQILLQVFSSAYNSFLNQQKEKKLIFELNEKILQLNNLIDADIELSRYDKQNVLFDLAIERIVTLTNASSALVRVVNKSDNTIKKQITFPNGLMPENIISNSYKIEYSFDFNEKHYLFVLSEKETRKGVTSFSELDKLLLQAISRQVQASIENEYLLNQSIEKERIEKELNLAAAIQQRIIPKELPKIDGYEVAGINIPSKEVGGDYYDCIELGNGKFALIIADVAGKGISAALLVNTLSAALHSYLEFNLPLTELAEKLNNLIFKSSPADKYITFFIAVLNSASGELDILNAGHNPALLLREDGTIEQVEAGGIGLGMLDFGMPYTGQSLKINDGDKLFLYTDGIPEAMNINEAEYSDERMVEFLKKYSNENSTEFIKLIVEDVKRFAREVPQSDDITSLFIKKT